MKTFSLTFTVLSSLVGLLVPLSATANELSQDWDWDWEGNLDTFSLESPSEIRESQLPIAPVVDRPPLSFQSPGEPRSQIPPTSPADLQLAPPLELQLLAQQPPRDFQVPAQPNVLPDSPEAPELDPTLPSLPPPEELLRRTPQAPFSPEDQPGIPETIVVNRYEIVGSTVFTLEELAEVTQEFTGEAISFAQLLQARSAITDLYVDKGYINSGAFLPEQTLEDGVVKIQVVEGVLSEINIEGLRRLSPRYVRERVELAAGQPLNVPSLLEGLRLLQLDPLIETISAELSAGIRPGESILDLTVTQAPTFSAQALLDNGRVPSVGSQRRQLVLNESTLFGQGDNITLRFNNTEGSNSVDLDYVFPINARNGTFRFFYSRSGSEVIEAPFDILEIRSRSTNYEFELRQPIIQTTTQEFTTSVSLTNRSTETSLEIGEERIGFPLSAGASDEGDTSVTVLRVAQEWVRRGPNQVFGLRSQFNFGTDWFGSTINSASSGLPDSSFFSWQGQGQWVRQFAPDLLLLTRANIQLADQPLLSLEQFGIGGFNSVRGYRQDRLLTDNGFLGSIEARIPIFRIPQIDSVAQITPFFDYGVGWNSDTRVDPDPGQLASVGLGLRWTFANRITARLDWGIPLINDDPQENSLQENGILFSITTDLVR